MDSSKAKGYHAGCHTAYVFVTDGVAPSPETMIRNRQQRIADEHFFVISLGSGTDQDELKTLACGIRGMYQNVPDTDTDEGKVALYQVATRVYYPPPYHPCLCCFLCF